jgi:hypothetical protein
MISEESALGDRGQLRGALGAHPDLGPDSQLAQEVDAAQAVDAAQEVGAVDQKEVPGRDSAFRTGRHASQRELVITSDRSAVCLRLSVNLTARHRVHVSRCTAWGWRKAGRAGYKGW